MSGVSDLVIMIELLMDGVSDLTIIDRIAYGWCQQPCHYDRHVFSLFGIPLSFPVVCYYLNVAFYIR